MRKTIYCWLVLLVLSGCSRGQSTAQTSAATAVPTRVLLTLQPTVAAPLTTPATMPEMAPQVVPETGGEMGPAMEMAGTPAGMPMTEHSHLTAGPHIATAPGGAPTEAERQQAEQIRAVARAAFEKYRDYRQALQDGYVVFAPEVPQDVYHFINYRQTMRNQGAVDPLRPTALLYRKVGDGWEWYGVMYSAPYETRPEALDRIYPRSLGEWHAHVNICLPPNAGSWLNNLEAAVNDPQFGFEGSIATRAACSAAGGRFYPDVLGWMVHVDLQ